MAADAAVAHHLFYSLQRRHGRAPGVAAARRGLLGRSARVGAGGWAHPSDRASATYGACFLAGQLSTWLGPCQFAPLHKTPSPTQEALPRWQAWIQLDLYFNPAHAALWWRTVAVPPPVLLPNWPALSALLVAPALLANTLVGCRAGNPVTLEFHAPQCQ